MTILTQQTGQFSGYTLSDLRALVLRMLRVTDTSRYSATSASADYAWIDDALNRGQEKFVRRTQCLRTIAIVETKANYRTYRLPWNFLDFMAAYYYDTELSDGYKELKVTTIEELNDEVSNWRVSTGSPERIYIDRIYGNNWMFGLYPFPNVDGDTITFDSNYGAVTQWVCPNYTFSSEYGIIIRMTDTDEYALNTDAGVVAQIQSMNKNILFEYYRLPEMLVDLDNSEGLQGTQYPEIPREYQTALAYYAVSDLLSNNPEDSAEFKRSQAYEQRFYNEIETYIDKRKKPLAGHNLRTKAAVWSWVENMPFYKGMP
jgi:hypothetical protein